MNLGLSTLTYIFSSIFHLIILSVSFFYLRKQFDHTNKIHTPLRFIFYSVIVLIISGTGLRLVSTETIAFPVAINGMFFVLSIITLPVVAGLTFCFITETMTKIGKHCYYAFFTVNAINIILVGISFIPGTNIYLQLANGDYVAGKFISLFFIFSLAYYLASIVVILRNWIRIGRHESFILLMLVLLPAVGSVIQMHPSLYYFPLTIMGIVLSFVILAMNIQHSNASTDYLTGLYNRRSLTMNLRKKINSMRRDEQFTVFMLDIDGFKNINDTHGHLVGDNVLHELADYLRIIRKNGDSVFRFGGDEFVIISQISDEKEIKDYIKFMRDELKNYVPRLTKDIALDFSVGFTIYEKSSDKSVVEILIEIDDYMYRDKRLRAQKKKPKN